MTNPTSSISRLLRTISPAPRLRILLAIDTGEACVCHLEAALGWRQAYISQHLMALRDAGVLASRRAGRFIYYRLQEPGLLDLIDSAARLASAELTRTVIPQGCACPVCLPSTELTLAETLGPSGVPDEPQ